MRVLSSGVDKGRQADWQQHAAPVGGVEDNHPPPAPWRSADDMRPSFRCPAAGGGEAEEGLEDPGGRRAECQGPVLPLTRLWLPSVRQRMVTAAGRRGVVEGVGDQVGDHLAQQQAVAVDLAACKPKPRSRPRASGEADPFGAAVADRLGQVDGGGEAGVSSRRVSADRSTSIWLI